VLENVRPILGWNCFRPGLYFYPCLRQTFPSLCPRTPSCSHPERAGSVRAAVVRLRERRWPGVAGSAGITFFLAGLPVAEPARALQRLSERGCADRRGRSFPSAPSPPQKRSCSHPDNWRSKQIGGLVQRNCHHPGRRNKFRGVLYCGRRTARFMNSAQIGPAVEARPASDRCSRHSPPKQCRADCWCARKPGVVRCAGLARRRSGEAACPNRVAGAVIEHVLHHVGDHVSGTRIQHRAIGVVEVSTTSPLDSRMEWISKGSMRTPPWPVPCRLRPSR